MSNQSTLDDTELGKFICSHPESSKRVDWERVACLGVGEYATPYLCAECGLPVPSTEPRWTFGKSLLTALVGTLLIVTLGALGIVPWILFGIWALLAIAFLYQLVRVVPFVVSLVLLFVVPLVLRLVERCDGQREVVVDQRFEDVGETMDGGTA